MIEIKKNEDCCGCTACVNSCPKNCILMTKDEEGFFYPQIDKDNCINCGLCEKACPLINKPNIKSDSTKAYVCRYNDPVILNESTSGGAFSAVAEYILKNKGIVFGALFDDKFNVYHDEINDILELNKLRGSKYAQSDLNFVFTRIREYLEKDIEVLFSGTPCQVAGLKKFLVKDYNNLLTVDIICRSIPSPLFWEEYRFFLEKKYKSKIKKVKFRNKTYGYHSGTFIAEMENGKTVKGSNSVNPFMKAFHMNICSRPSCYNCNFKTVNRVSDFTIFDSWKPENLVPGLKDDDLGYSGILTHSIKAEKLLKKITGVSLYQVDLEQALSYTGRMAEQSIPYSEKRNSFYIDLKKIGFENTIKKYVPITIKEKLFEYSKGFLYKTSLLSKIKKFKKR